MKVRYSQEVDALTIRFNAAAIAGSQQVVPGVILDFDKDGRLVGMEILDASKCVDQPRAVELSVVTA